MVNSADIITTARRYLGVPFHHQGRNSAGLDCVGLLVVVARDLGIRVRDRDGYGRQPHRGLLTQGLRENLCPVSADERQPGDIVEIRIADDPQHVAIYTGQTIIHALWRRDGGVVCEHRFSGYWRDRVVASYRFPGVD